MPGRIWIAPFSGVDAAWLDYLSVALEEELGVAPRFLPELDASNAYDAGRGQTNAGVLLRLLLENLPPVDGESWRRVIGIASEDLFAPVLSFVFGQAQLGGEAAIVSAHRLDEARYGLPPDPELLLARLEKEVWHELGHTFGLRHCHRNGCVMRFSSEVEEVDQKQSRYCEECAAAIRGFGVELVNV